MSQDVSERKRRVYVVEDHAIVCEGITRLIDDEEDLAVCGHAAGVSEAKVRIPEMKPDVAIIDLSLKDSNGLELIQLLRLSCPELPMLVLSMHDESLHAERALRAGARGYVMKQDPPERFLLAIRRVLDGQIHLSDNMSNRMLSRMVDKRSDTAKAPLERLTAREMEIYSLFGEGRLPAEIAERLGLSVKTVDAHRENLKRKLGLKSAAELMRHAMRHTPSL